MNLAISTQRKRNIPAHGPTIEGLDHSKKHYWFNVNPFEGKVFPNVLGENIDDFKEERPGVVPADTNLVVIAVDNNGIRNPLLVQCLFNDHVCGRYLFQFVCGNKQKFIIDHAAVIEMYKVICVMDEALNNI